MAPGPLSGVRVLDLTWFLAGPYATHLMNVMGAEVIKVESMKRVDNIRLYTPDMQGVAITDPTSVPPEVLCQTPAWQEVNFDKKGLTLNLAHPKARGIILDLVRTCDVMIDNFSAGVLDRRGIGYNDVRRVRPDIIVLSASSSGQFGPQKHYAGLATIFSAQSGLSNMTGYPDLLPTDVRDGMDLRVGTGTCFALMSAVVYRQRTGKGQFIDLAARDVPSVLIGEALMDYFMTGRVHTRDGNKDDIMAPHNCYPCKGKDKWVSIVVNSDEEWKALCQAVGRPEWVDDPRFNDQYRRWKNQDELDRLLGAWTKDYTHYEVMEKLQRVGVAAMPAMNSEEIFNDRHFNEWGAFVEVSHPVIGTRKVIGAPWKFSESEMKMRTHGPMIGEHNEYVFGEVLGLSTKDVRSLVEEQVIV